MKRKKDTTDLFKITSGHIYMNKLN